QSTWTGQHHVLQTICAAQTQIGKSWSQDEATRETPGSSTQEYAPMRAQDEVPDLSQPSDRTVAHPGSPPPWSPLCDAPWRALSIPRTASRVSHRRLERDKWSSPLVPALQS